MATKTNSGMSNTTFRIYAVVLIAMAWTAGYFHGKSAEAAKEENIANEQLSKINEVYAEKLANRPTSHDAVIERLRELY